VVIWHTWGKNKKNKKNRKKGFAQLRCVCKQKMLADPKKNLSSKKFIFFCFVRFFATHF